MLNKNALIVFASFFFLLNSCQKDSEVNPVSNSSPKLLADVYSSLRIEKVDPIFLNRSKSELKDLLDNRKQNALYFIQDSTWNGGGTKIYRSDEVVVTPNNEDYVYPGSIIKSASVVSGNFAPLKGYTRKPIQISTTFVSDKASGTIDIPSLSKTRVFLRDALMSPGFSGNQLEDFSFSASSFSSYEESKMSFGYNANHKSLFSSVNSSFNQTNGKTSYNTGLIMTYTVKNFTLSMSDPQIGELIDYQKTPASVFEGVSPVYVDAVTYGRFGFIMIETNFYEETAKKTFEKLVKKWFKKTNETFSSEELQVFSNSRLTVYLMGSPNAAVIQMIDKPQSIEGFSSFVTENLGEFTASDPGVPIQFTLKYLKDNTYFKPLFHVDYYN